MIGEFGAGRVLMKPAAPVPASSPAVLSVPFWKRSASRTFTPSACAPTIPQNVVSAAFEGLKSLRSPEEVARIRGKSVEEILG